MASAQKNNPRILIVDDIPKNIEVIGTILRNEGFLISIAEGGAQALKILKKSSPDLILLDIMMPEMDGLETCEQIKKNPATKDIPVIFLSGLSHTVNKVEGFKLGAVDYLTKPVEPEEALARIKTHLSIRNLQRELKNLNRSLEEKVQTRTEELLRKNKLLEEEMDKRREKEYLIKSASSAIVLADPQGILNYVNPSFLKTWAYEDDGKVLKKHFSEFWLVGEILDELTKALAKESKWTGEVKAKKKTALYSWFRS